MGEHPVNGGSPAGGKGFLAEEEEKLVKLRQEKEEEVTREIQKQRQQLEQEARAGQLDKLWATPFGVDVVGITEFIALTGALVGGMCLADVQCDRIICVWASYW